MKTLYLYSTNRCLRDKQQFGGIIRFVVLLSLLLLPVLAAVSQVKLPAVISDGMMLQRDTVAVLWGWADPGREVVITSSWGVTAQTRASDRGQWTVRIQSPPAGGPYTITFDDGTPYTVKNILSGEVWLCSGQSNMVMNVKNALNPEKEQASADYPDIRIFKVEPRSSYTPLDDVRGRWESPAIDNVFSMGAVPYFFARDLHGHLGVPVGIVHTALGASANEAWMAEIDIQGIAPVEKAFAAAKAEIPEDDLVKMRKVATTLYNAMLAPLIPYTVKGFCWYQGEGNRMDPATYRILLPRLITSWRRQWGDDSMPFIVAQLSGFGRNGVDLPGWVDIQMEQFAVSQNMEHVATVMTYDVGDRDDIHPKDKQTVAARFALAARKLAYGERIPAQGPVLARWRSEGNTAVLEFTGFAGGLTVSDGSSRANCFEAAGDDGVFHTASAVITSPSQITLTSDNVSAIRRIRYAGYSFNPGVNFYNSAELPAVPFRSDNPGN